jgi:hypothetical protein
MKPEIRFEYQSANDYRPVFVNGAHGGVSPRGEMVIHFYHERPTLPSSITHELTAGGTIGREIAQDPPSETSTMIRSIETGIILTYDNARNLHQWLGERLKEMETLEKARAAMAAGLEKGSGETTH